MPKGYIAVLFGFFFIVQLLAQRDETSILIKSKGLYQDNAGEIYIVNPGEGFPHFTFLKSGKTHMLRHKEGQLFEFSHTRNNWNSIGGTLEFIPIGEGYKMCISFLGREEKCAQQIPIHSQELSLTLGPGLTIVGDFIQPLSPKSDMVAVLLHGDGENDRYDLYDVGMYLIHAGYSVFAFDKRNAGNSKGPVVDGNGYDEISRVYASDAANLILQLMQGYPEKRFGVIGISQGGWIGSIVSAKIPSLSFYVNIAGSISIGWQQWRHYMLSYLKRSSFSHFDVAEAEDYFTSFFDAGLDKITFEEYQTKLLQYQEKDWFKKLEKRKLIAWKDKRRALEVMARNSNDPSLDVIKVKAPTLGIFYEFDHSTPPDTPSVFLNALRDSEARDISVRVFPNSTHGGWVVDSFYFDSSKITRMEPRAYYVIVDWLDSLRP